MPVDDQHARTREASDRVDRPEAGRVPGGALLAQDERIDLRRIHLTAQRVDPSDVLVVRKADAGPRVIHHVACSSDKLMPL
ncbi:MAG TPA: hypothetical protein VFT50_09675 [Baekduia sp.]|nr:hypothetical protein [Baekduia sp.]